MYRLYAGCLRVPLLEYGSAPLLSPTIEGISFNSTDSSTPSLFLSPHCSFGVSFVLLQNNFVSAPAAVVQLSAESFVRYASRSKFLSLGSVMTTRRVSP
jgi:hypothetical protein